jgi:hypothetical protein
VLANAATPFTTPFVMVNLFDVEAVLVSRQKVGSWILFESCIDQSCMDQSLMMSSLTSLSDVIADIIESCQARASPGSL